MQIQCPSCHARTNLSGDHEGAKVRCPECGRVHVARSQGGQGRGKAARLIGGSVGVLALAAVVFFVRTCRAEPLASAARRETTPLPDWYKDTKEITIHAGDARTGELELDRVEAPGPAPHPLETQNR